MNLLTANTLTPTGEIIKNFSMYIGIVLLIGIIFFLLWKKKKEKDSNKK